MFGALRSVVYDDGNTCSGRKHRRCDRSWGDRHCYSNVFWHSDARRGAVAGRNVLKGTLPELACVTKRYFKQVLYHSSVLEGTYSTVVVACSGGVIQPPKLQRRTKGRDPRMSLVAPRRLSSPVRQQKGGGPVHRHPSVQCTPPSLPVSLPSSPTAGDAGAPIAVDQPLHPPAQTTKRLRGPARQPRDPDKPPASRGTASIETVAMP